jgi:hypothetical protein
LETEQIDLEVQEDRLYSFMGYEACLTGEHEVSDEIVNRCVDIISSEFF